MKKLMPLAAGIVASVLIVAAGCTTAQQQKLADVAATAKVQVAQACAVVQPTLLDLSASLPNDANLKQLAADNGEICAAAKALDSMNAQSLVNTLIPQAIVLVGLLPIDPAAQASIRLALGAASIALSNWLVVYGTSAAVFVAPAGSVAPFPTGGQAVPISSEAPAAASTPLTGVPLQ
ncbi:hypothetical protein [Burkholderia cenocepacia]|uniref:Lipoprotein n=1 Tax=Burkholderia cenocepacia TaxID=95486 RepID=A0A6B2MCI6_9BURK|nr:hypothetical protein [Burkholderia cenocepacia]NDV72964.1 hypothetical protein [Burkholderia cenocepacia]